MDAFITFIFFIMMLILVGVFVYFLYDYISYKIDVDKSVETTTKYINTSFEKVNNNIEISENTVNSNLKLFNSQLNKLQNDEEIIHQQITSNISKIDKKLNKFFQFNEENVSSNISSQTNNKIYNYVTSSVFPNFNVLTNVTAMQGITINTNSNFLNNNNLRICNDKNNCIQMNVNNYGFNITPENINLLNIKNKDNSSLASFNMQKKEIYLGGNDINAPLFINSNQLYINNINLLLKNPNTKYTNKDFASIQKLNLEGSNLQILSQNISNFYLNNTELVNNIIDNTTRVFDNVNQVFVYYEISNVSNNSNEITNTFSFKAIPQKPLKMNDKISFILPHIETSNLLFNNVHNFYNNDYQSIIIKDSSATSFADNSVIKISLSKIIDKNYPIYFNIVGNNLIKNPIYKYKSGFVLGNVV